MIIYSNQLNQTEFLRSRAIKEINSFNVRVFNFTELIDDANMRLALSKVKCLSRQESLFLIEKFIRDIHPFSSFLDVRHVHDTLRETRMNITTSEELKFFNDKVFSLMPNDQNIIILNNIFKKYLEELNNNNTIDEIILAHLLINNQKTVYDEIYVLEEENRLPLEMEFLKSIAKKVTSKPLSFFYNKELKEQSQVDAIKTYYGEQSEVDGVLNDIAKNHYPLDECLIVLANKDKYVHLLFENSKRYNLPITFECGLPIRLTNSYKMYHFLDELEHMYFFDVNGYYRLLRSDAFKHTDLIDDKYSYVLAELLGRLKINFSKTSNDETLKAYNAINNNYKIAFLEKVDKRPEFINVATNVLDLNKCVNIFSQGKQRLIDQYVAIDSNDEAFNAIAKECIISYLDKSEHLTNKDIFAKTYLEEIDEKYITGKTALPGSLHVCTLNQSLSTIRPHIYLVGFNANNFPGKPRENYLMNDHAYHLLNSNITNASNQKINDKINYFWKIINLYKSIGSSVQLSYSCKDIENAKSVNPSGVVFECAVQNKISLEEDFKNAKQFDNDISPLRALAKHFNNKETLVTKPFDSQPLPDTRDLLNKVYSPSTLTNYLKCPLRFYLTNVLYADLKKPYDSLKIIPANTYGDLLHLIMEIYVKNQQKYPNETAFEQLVSEVYYAYQHFNVPLVKNEEDYDDFLTSCFNAYRELNKPDVELVEAEYNIDDVVVDGVKFHGSIDLVIKNKKTGEYYIYDYKTGSNPSHADDDFDKDIQGITYAYMYEQKTGRKASQVVFFYTRANKKFIYHDPFNNNTKNMLNDLLGKFKNNLTDKEFPIAIFDDNHKEDDICKYCNFMNVCHKEKKA